MLERGVGLGQTVATAARRLIQQVKKGSTKRVRFDSKPSIQTFSTGDEAVMITYDSGADGHYMSRMTGQNCHFQSCGYLDGRWG